MGFLGFGFSPFGVTPFGFGTVPSLNTTAARLFIQPDGSQGNCPKIDPTSRDYVLDPNTGIKIGSTSTPEMVALALLTVQGSSADPSFGLLPPSGVFTSDAATRADAAVRAALKHLTSKKFISIQSVALVRPFPVAGQIQVKWVDLNDPTGEIQYNYVSLAP